MSKVSENIIIFDILTDWSGGPIGQTDPNSSKSYSVLLSCCYYDLKQRIKSYVCIVFKDIDFTLLPIIISFTAIYSMKIKDVTIEIDLTGSGLFSQLTGGG
jgi:hypothetical protein